MKILLALDGSEHSLATVKEVARRPWPAGTTVRILCVCSPFPYSPLTDPLFVSNATDFDKLNRAQATLNAENAANQIRAASPQLEVEVEVLQGSPKQMIVDEAGRWGADLIILGSHGHGPVHRFLLGSVVQAVVFHAHCSVEVVRMHHRS